MEPALPSPLQKHSRLCERLAFCHRQIKASIAHISVERSPRKNFPIEIKTLGDAIRVGRKEKRLTERQLAHLLGVSVQSVDKWENNRKMPEGATLEVLTKLLGLKYPPESEKPDR